MMSMPIASSLSVARSGVAAPSRRSSTYVTMNAYAGVATAASPCQRSCSAFPYRRPSATPFHDSWAKNPMNRIPVRPAMPWAARTSSVSSTRVRGRHTMIA
jgi:hypothetical protein